MPDWTYHPVFKPLLFRLPPEDGRALTLRLLELQARTAAGRRLFRLFGHGPPPPSLAVDVFGLRFPGPIGLGPGIDTYGTALSVMQHLGFGFLVVGPGGDAALRRRHATDPLRVPERHAIVTSPQAGGPSAAALAARIRGAPDLAIPVGVALRGARPVAALKAAHEAASFLTLSPACASDPTIFPVLRAVTTKPLLLRLSPDWSADRLEEVLDHAVAAGVDGVVAVAGGPCPLLPDGELDGPFLRARALATITRVARRYGDRLPIVGAGGVTTPDDALALLDAGAKLVELFSGLVYAGPGLPGRIVHALEARPPKPRPKLVVIDEATGAPMPDEAPALPPGADDLDELSPDEKPTELLSATDLREATRVPDVEETPTARAGWVLLAFTGWTLVASGLFALALAATTKLLPHDVRYLGMTVRELCDLNACRVVHFMAHDRVSFGGAMIAIGALYHALATGPVRRGEAWAWWTFLASGAVGFGSFLSWLGYGYLDVWHGWATLALLPVFIAGLAFSFGALRGSRGPSTLARQGAKAWAWSPAGRGRALLTFSGLGMVLGGLTIMVVGMTRVFVPQDLAYMGLTVADLHALNPRLVSVIAHDRAGFGGGLLAGGLTVLATLWCGLRPGERGLWSALCAAGVVGFGTAIGVHPLVGYTSFVHLLPAYLGALAFVLGIALLYRPVCLTDAGNDRFPDV